jgi:anti-sigma factor RsiW
MSIERHPLAQLSAYLDEALGPADRAAIDAHLDTCASCRARLGELRATVSLIGALPDLAPTRRLTPRVAPAPAWLAPLRTMTTLASGLSVFVFLATALLANVGGVTSSGTAAAPAAPQASAAPTNQSRGVAPAPAAAPTALNAADSAKLQTAPSGAPAPSGAAGASAGAGFSVTSGSQAPGSQAPAEVGARSDNTQAQGARDARPVLTSPWLWLGLAIVFGIAAIGLQRRLRST